MSSDDGRTGGAWALQEYLRVLRRRKWIVVFVVVLATALAIVLSRSQSRVYEASSEVLLSHQNLVASVGGVQDSNSGSQPDRVAQTQADVAQVPIVAARALRRAGVTNLTPTRFLNNSSVAPKPDADLLVFSVRSHSPAVAMRLASAYALEFTKYQTQLQTRALDTATAEVSRRIAVLRAQKLTRSPLYLDLAQKEQQLRALEALVISDAYVVRPATSATQIQPRPLRNALLAFALGLLAGIALAFAWEAVDTRVRAADEVSQRLGLPLLGRLPKPSASLRRRGQLAMLVDPEGHAAEAYRILRTNVEFVNLDRGAQVIMATSAREGEGKSTTVANLAVALARIGRRVVLIDLDLRAPSLDRFFELGSSPGLTEVALGHATLDEAVHRVALAPAAGSRAQDGAPLTNGSARVDGFLDLISSGPTPPNAGEFIASSAVVRIIDEVSQDHDIVLIDAPPLLSVGDAMALTLHVDALIVVAKLTSMRRHVLRELGRVLDGSQAVPLGVVVTGADAGGIDGYYKGAYRPARRTRRLRRKRPETVG